MLVVELPTIQSFFFGSAIGARSPLALLFCGCFQYLLLRSACGFSRLRAFLDIFAFSACATRLFCAF